ncbi:RidA family protein [Yoonia sp. 208BN28-4]|uniref:RidA family protein n=1 Tax=Yoonia sp. 208BN28-4 TaxID=3126505 RepID=UPI0030970210
MHPRRYKSGGVFEDKVGYARAVVAGGFVFVSGCVAPGDDVPEDVTDQCAAALELIRRSLEQAGSDMARVVRVTYMLPNPDDFEPCWPLLKAAFGDHPPAATMISCDLIHPRYKIEIEVTALLIA